MAAKFIGLGKAHPWATRNDVFRFLKTLNVTEVKSMHQEYIKGPTGVWYLQIDNTCVPKLSSINKNRHHIGLAKSLTDEKNFERTKLFWGKDLSTLPNRALITTNLDSSETEVPVLQKQLAKQFSSYGVKSADIFIPFKNTSIAVIGFPNEEETIRAFYDYNNLPLFGSAKTLFTIVR